MGAESARTLYTTGSEAVARYRTNPTVHGGAIVDAAIAFELAHRMRDVDTDETLVTDIQASLFWCKKQMALGDLKLFNERLAAMTAGKPAAKPVQAVKPSPQATLPKPDRESQQGGVDAVVLTEWVNQLQARTREVAQAGRGVTFELTPFRTQATVTELHVDGTMTLDIAGSGSTSYAWKQLSNKELADMADDLVRQGQPQQHALAAFFLLLSGNQVAGRNHLMRSATYAAHVERSLQLTPSARNGP